jgi:hypothetical protein
MDRLLHVIFFFHRHNVLRKGGQILLSVAHSFASKKFPAQYLPRYILAQVQSRSTIARYNPIPQCSASTIINVVVWVHHITIQSDLNIITPSLRDVNYSSGPCAQDHV